MSVICSVCHEDINFSDEEISVLHCGHMFHQTCLQQWLGNRMTCPECRSAVTKDKFVKRIYPSINKDLVYRGSSDETKTILNVFNENNTNFQKMFIKRITLLEEQNKDFASKNSKLEENLKITWVTMRSLQKENKDKDEKLNKMKKENEKLKAHNKILKEDINSDFEKLKTICEKHELYYKKLIKENRELKVDHNKLEEENNKLKERLKTKNKELKKVLKEQKVSISDLDNENKELKNDHNKLKEDSKKLTERLKTKTKELEILKEQKVSISDLENENKELKSKLTLVSEILVTKSKTAVFEKSIIF